MPTPQDIANALARVTAALPGGGEVRSGQVAMAEAVAAAIESRRSVVVQAGTGTGKGLAYLVPAILSGKRVVVSTATKALQDQLAHKDLPFLQEHLGKSFEFAVLKGRSNYFCRQRALEVDGGGDQLSLEESEADPEVDLGPLGREVKALLEWAKTAETGDRSDLTFEPRPRAWATLSVSAMECPGASKCPSGETCFAEAARVRAETADVIVVNTYLYGAHLGSGGNVLPEHDLVVFDEAHELEDIAATSLGLELTAGRFRALARTARGLAQDTGLCDDVDTVGTRLEDALAPLLGQRLPQPLPAELDAALDLASARVNKLVAEVRAAKADPGRSARVLQAGGHLAGDIGFLKALPSTHVAWVEGQPHSPVLVVGAVDVGELLAGELWGMIPAVLTSATVPLRATERLGLDPERTDVLDVGSPFDFQEQAMLYCAAHLPDPRKPEYEAAMHAELLALLQAASGRTLALFTSWRAMRAAAEALKDEVPFRIYLQSDLPKPALVAAFSADEESCLFATMGFWQGVDVPGPSLTQVVIDRIPFPRPDEPLMQARRDRAGPSAFRVIDLPRAATLLAQGAGRLIRSKTDRGVVAILDPRLATAGYKWDLVNALPPMRRTKDRADVESFLKLL